jgi:predicted transcriptional regulator
MKRPTHLTPGEFELMQILWGLGAGSVKQIWQKVDPQRNLAYTTVMTVLDKMRRKGILSQQKRGKAHWYTPTIRRDQALAGVIEHIVDNYFNGSRTDFLRFVGQKGSAHVGLTPSGRKQAKTAGPKTDEESPIEEFLL